MTTNSPAPGAPAGAGGNLVPFSSPAPGANPNLIPNPNAAGIPSGPGIHDIKPPVEIPTGWEWVMVVAGALVLAAILYWAWKSWRKRRAEVLAEPVEPAHVRARRKLQEALALIGQPREFCILVSDTIRWYLEERFDFRAPERTTEEFLHELRATNLLTFEQKESLGQFLQSCDLVKFARYEPAQPELRALHESAVRLVDETEPREVAATETAAMSS